MKLKFCLLVVILLHLCVAGNSIFHVPFDIIENVPVVSATINGVSKNFIFDTGAKSMVINGKYLPNNNHETNNNYDVKGISGSFSSCASFHVKDFTFGDIIKTNFIALALDISLLEEQTGKEIFGLIGYEMFRGYDIFIDYEDGYFSFIPSNEFMNYWNMNIINQQFESLYFETFDHIPVVKALAGEKQMKLGIDSGSARTIIGKEALKLIQHEISNLSEQQIIGIENKNITISGAKIRNLNIGTINFPQLDILINDLSHLNKTNRNIDGIIGFDLFSRYKTLISYKNNIIVLVK